jgi:hypothetical protein
LPVVPDELPEILNSFENTSFTTHTKTLTLLGNQKPKSFTLDLFLPTRDYTFCKGNGEEVIELLDYVTENKIPARLIVTDGLKELLNIAIAISSYTPHYDTVGNIKANVECVEYVFLYQPKTQTESDEEPVFSEISVTYGNKTVQVKSANISGHNLVMVRTVIELLGREVNWNAEKKRVTAGRVLLDIHTEIYDGVAYCYIRDIADTLELEVEYNAEDKSVILKDGE